MRCKRRMRRTGESTSRAGLLELCGPGGRSCDAARVTARPPICLSALLLHRDVPLHPRLRVPEHRAVERVGAGLELHRDARGLARRHDRAVLVEAMALHGDATIAARTAVPRVIVFS